VDRAVALTSYAAPGGVSFGRLNPTDAISRLQKVSVTDLNGNSRRYSVTHVPNQTFPGVKVSCPDTVKLNAKGEGSFNIQLKFIPSDSWAAGAYDDAFESQTEVDGWCILNDGKDTLRVGYIAVVDPASDVLVKADKNDNSVHLFNFGPSIGWAEGFTLAKLDGEVQNGTYGSIAAVGFRKADPNSPLYFGLDTLEFGLSLEKAFEHLSNLTFEFAVDANNDGVADWFMVGTDLSNLDPNADPGVYVAAQFNANGQGFLDWVVNTWDFNDRTLILPFTLQSGGGFLPTKFNYVLTVTARDGAVDVQHGSVDLAQEIVPDVNSFGVEPGKVMDVNLSGPKGKSLWLLQNNVVAAQQAVTEKAK
jgi:hypothetical protein